MKSYTWGRYRPAIVKAYAQALFDVLKEHTYRMSRIFVALPNQNDFLEWRDVFGDYDALIHLVPHKEMLTTAHALADADIPTGILNTTSEDAILSGKLGGNWEVDNGQMIDNEERVAVSTTVLLHNKSKDIEVWKRPPNDMSE